MLNTKEGRMDTRSQRGSIRILAIVVTGVLVITAAAAMAAGGGERAGKRSARGVQGDSEAREVVEQSDFSITEIAWSGRDDDAPTLEVGPAQDGALADCGSDALPGSVLALAGVAYCIQGVDSSDHESIFAARVVAEKLINGGDFNDAELEVMRLETLAGYADPESPEAAELWDQYLAAWEALSREEQEHLKE